MLWILSLPFRFTLGVARLFGLRRLVVFGAGLGAGLLLAPVPGAELRERLRQRLEALGSAEDSDVAVAERVRHELSQSPRTWHLPQPEVEVVAGRARLSGEVPHASGKADIERAAAAVRGVVEIDSKLVVFDATAEQPGSHQ